MLTEQRFAEIISIVEAKKTATVQELSTALGCSESTIRRDLISLDSEGALTKVFGGATVKNGVFRVKEDSIGARLEHNHDEKMRIGRYAASLISDDDFVYLDAGTTTGCMIDFIRAKHARFVTNSFYHAKALSRLGFHAYILGGEIKQPTEAIIGAEAIESLSKYHFTKGFWGTNGVSPESGFNTPDPNEAAVKKTAMHCTQEKYIVCDAEKFSRISCITFAEFTEAHIITTQINASDYAQYSNITEVDCL